MRSIRQDRLEADFGCRAAFSDMMQRQRRVTKRYTFILPLHRDWFTFV